MNQKRINKTLIDQKEINGENLTRLFLKIVGARLDMLKIKFESKYASYTLENTVKDTCFFFSFFVGKDTCFLLIFPFVEVISG